MVIPCLTTWVSTLTGDSVESIFASVRSNDIAGVRSQSSRERQQQYNVYELERDSDTTRSRDGEEIVLIGRRGAMR
jgi:hypothetical protein